VAEPRLEPYAVYSVTGCERSRARMTARQSGKPPRSSKRPTARPRVA